MEETTVITHLKELKKRLIVCIVALVVGFLIAYTFSDGIYDLLAGPLMPQLPEDSEYLVFTGVVEPFFIYLKVGFLGGAIFASPVLFHQIWAFVAPGLYDTEKRWFGLLVLGSLALFLFGVLFAYFVVFPFGFKYLLSYAGPELKPILSMSSYFSLVTRLLLAFGIIYQLPLAMLVAARMGVVTPRKLLRWWRYALILIFAAAALITPTPDIFNQLLMAGPLVVLYAIGVAAAYVFGKKVEEEEEEGEGGAPEGGEGEGEEGPEE